jgi:hypothetical protein
MLWSFGTRFPFWFVACTNIWQHWSAWPNGILDGYGKENSSAKLRMYVFSCVCEFGWWRTGWPDELLKIIAQNVSQHIPILSKWMHHRYRVEK